jgi:hypothetical protein
MKNVIASIFLLAFVLSFPVLSEADQCQKLLDKVDSYPAQRLYELVQRAPDSCKVAIKTKIFENRRVIVDDFRRR